MRKFGIVAGLLLFNLTSQSHLLAQDLEVSALAASETITTLGVSGRCVGNSNELTIEWGGTATKFEIRYNGNPLDTRTSPGIKVFRPGTRVSTISVKGCKGSACDTDTRTWNGSDCSRPRPSPGPGGPDPF